MNNDSTRLTYSIDDTCAALGIGRTFLYQEIQAGRLKARKAGKRTLILTPDLEAYAKALPTMAAA